MYENSQRKIFNKKLKLAITSQLHSHNNFELKQPLNTKEFSFKSKLTRNAELESMQVQQSGKV